jgi:hypothetical protein
VERLGACPLPGPTRDRHPLAADRLQTLLDQAEPPEPARSPEPRPGGPSAHRTNISRQPPLGCAADSRGTAETGHRDLAGDSVQTHGPPSKATIANLRARALP